MNEIIHAWAQEHVAQIAEDVCLMLEMEDPAGREYETRTLNESQSLRDAGVEYGITIGHYEVVNTGQGIIMTCKCYGFLFVETRVFL